MGRAGAALLVVALAARAAAAAESDFPRVVGKAGVYVVSSCGIVGYGARFVLPRRLDTRAS